MPEGRQRVRELLALPTLCWCEGRSGWLLLKARIGFFDDPERLELLLPAAFEGGGYEAMLGIDRIVLPLGEADLILGPLALLLPMPVQAVLLGRLRLQYGVQGIEM